MGLPPGSFENIRSVPVITYEKGAWVLHMLRKRLGNERFLKVLAELRRQYQFREVGTADLLDLVRNLLLRA